MLFVAFPFLVVFLVARQINFAYKCKLHICPDKAVVFTLSSNWPTEDAHPSREIERSLALIEVYIWHVILTA